MAATLPAFLACALPLACAMPALAQTSAQSSSEDRQRFVSVVHKLERAPLDRSLWDDRSWAVQWLTDAPDVSVQVCMDPLGGVSNDRYPHSSEIIVHYMLAMGAFIVENPDKANDLDAQQLAGVTGALTAYRSMRTLQPDEKSPALEKLLEMQSRSELPEFVRKAYQQCLAKGGK